MAETDSYVVYSRDYKVTVDGHAMRLEGAAEVREGVDAAALRSLFVRDFFTTNIFQNVAVLAGAGTSVGCGGCIRGSLWSECINEIEKVSMSFRDKYEKFKKNTDIEGFLSYAMQYAELKVNKRLEKSIRELKVAIRQKCNLELKGNAHFELLRKLTARKSSLPRPEVFTTNYDTLFEQAAHGAGIVLIDGFSYGCPRRFFGRSYDFDIVDREKPRVRGGENFIPNVVRLYKLHGSVNWFYENGVVIQRAATGTEEPMMIYPSTNKYAESYSQPYFEMMARFQATLRKKDCLLMVCGYGFGDQHINSVILEALNQNPSFTLFVLDYGIADGDAKRIDLLTMRKNLGLDEIRGNVVIVQGTFDELVASMPLNKAYAVEMEQETHVTLEDSHGS